MAIGLNVLAQYVTDRARIQQTTASAGIALIMDDAGFARSLAAANPSALIVHRTYSANDHRWHEVMTPREWLDAHQATGGAGVTIQCLNEPNGYGDLSPLVTWCVEVMQQAHERGIALCLPNFGVGHPDTVNVANGALDPLLRAFVAHPEMTCGLHEYFRDDPMNEPYLVGRFTAIIDRCKALGIAPPTIAITEYGRDHAGGLSDGWRGVGLTDERYTALLTDTHRRLYAPHGIRCAVFCYGTGSGGMWQSFNVENSGVLDAIEEYNMTQQPTDKRTAIIKLDRGVNLRASAGTGGRWLTTVPFGAEIDVWLSPVESKDGFEWVRASWGANVGYIVRVYEGADTFTVTAPPPETDTPIPDGVKSEQLTDDELQALIEHYTAIAGIYRALQARRKAA